MIVSIKQVGRYGRPLDNALNPHIRNLWHRWQVILLMRQVNLVINLLKPSYYCWQVILPMGQIDLVIILLMPCCSCLQVILPMGQVNLVIILLMPSFSTHSIVVGKVAAEESVPKAVSKAWKTPRTTGSGLFLIILCAKFWCVFGQKKKRKMVRQSCSYLQNLAGGRCKPRIHDIRITRYHPTFLNENIDILIQALHRIIDLFTLSWSNIWD